MAGGDIMDIEFYCNCVVNDIKYVFKLRNEKSFMSFHILEIK